jgi:hypothetical protein
MAWEGEMKSRFIFFMSFIFILSALVVQSETPAAVTGLNATIEIGGGESVDRGVLGAYDPRGIPVIPPVPIQRPEEHIVESVPSSGPPAQPILPDRTILQDQPILLTYKLKNDSDKPVYVLRWGTPLEGFMSNLLDVRSSVGVKIDYNGYLVSRIGPLPEDYVEIPAGGSITAVLPVHEGYRVREAGKYTINLRQNVVIDAVHEQPKKAVAGEVNKRKFVPTNVDIKKPQAGFTQIKSRSETPLRPGTQSTPEPGVNAPSAPGSFRILNEAPHPSYHYGRGSGFFRYADYAPPPEVIKRHPELDVSDRKEIKDLVQQEKVIEAYKHAYRLAAESKVIMNAGENVVSSASRFATWFGASRPVREESKPDACKTWAEKFGPDDQTFEDRFAHVRATFGGIYNRFFETAKESLVRFFLGPKSKESTSSGLKYEVEMYPCDYRSVVAYVYGTETRPLIYLCDSFFDPPQGFQVDQAGVIIHELSHKASNKSGTDVVTDLVYESEECKDVALCVPDEAPKNADNYHLFASNPTGLGIGLAPGRWYAHFRTIDGTYLSAGIGNRLHVKNTDSSNCISCTFLVVATTNDPLRDGDTISLLTYDRVLSVTASGKIVSSDNPASFQIKKANGGGEISTGNEIYLVAGSETLSITAHTGNKIDRFIIELAR